MSSPPPYTPPNPLKRSMTSLSATSTNANTTAHKRPRMHPLRQTSFPTTIDDPRSGAPFSAAASDAGSVTGSFTGSLDGIFSGAGSAMVPKGGKKRGRKSKAEKEREKEREREEGISARGGEGRVGSVDVDGGSVRGGATGHTGGGGGGGGNTGAGGNEDAEEDEDFDYEGELLGREEGATDIEAEKKNLALLVDAFNPQQSERYDLFKRAKLRKETLRRIVNHALSQSVPASVVTTINGFTKVFAGEVIEKARTVQAQWAEAHDQAARAEFDEQQRLSNSTTTESDTTIKQEAGTQSQSQRVFVPPPNPHRGQLLPAHLREALRRYKRDGEGGGVGFSGLSMGNLGVRGSVTWSAGGVGGRRIFR
ncbi:hypothetical protein SI65_04974 [Aspergillus cristatus]|uniref:TAFII28-like protein domain-containing protein n=1 Tax=Aspergillus cristatus TaxID=573508 RepID=A0A1E3BGG9_ASPCR|nr:hypothetical protein SI65_04974 [Aspergillus cristatus]